jgi:transglutaminase-like putative cysteine protease
MASVYRIEHLTRYSYETSVTTSQHVAWLEPRELPYQHVRAFDLTVDPAPSRVLRRMDYFGNAVHQFQLVRPHDELRVASHSIVEVHDRTAGRRADGAASWEAARDVVRGRADRVSPDIEQYAFPSPQIALSAEVADFARESFPPARPLIDAAVDLMHRIHREFTFDPAATTAATPVSQVLADRRGVCQDFAHIQIACLRSFGLAARYVSGYLLTDPPPGHARLIGADASHAWLSVFSPDEGWVDLDPTNDMIVEERHVTIGWGRDYSDVTPLRGVLLGGTEHRLFVGVSVVPIETSA